MFDFIPQITIPPQLGAWLFLALIMLFIPYLKQPHFKYKYALLALWIVLIFSTNHYRGEVFFENNPPAEQSETVTIPNDGDSIGLTADF